MTRIVSKTGLVALTLGLALSFPAFADTVVKVSFDDKASAVDFSKNMGLGMGMKGNMSEALVSISIDQKTVPAGKVTFEATNLSKQTVHEMLVAPVADENAVLPYVDAENRVSEDGSKSIGEIPEVDPGKTGSVTFDLKPGVYALFCNIPGHYMGGMWTTLKVE